MTATDYLALLLYAALVLALGLRAGRGRRAEGDEFALAGRAVPAWLVLLSLLATELSAATFIGVPHAAWQGAWTYLQFAFGALLGKWALARVALPLYHRLGVVTVYGLLEARFGPATRRAAALAFVFGRLAASGVRLFIAALAFSLVTGTSVEAAIAGVALCSAIYTAAGGLRAVIYTDALQAAVLLLGAGAALAVLAARLPGGLPELVAWGVESGRMAVFRFEPLLSTVRTDVFGVAFAGGFFLTLATHGTDHDMAQRLLAARNGREAGRALLGSAWLNFPVTVLFLLIGTGLARFYAEPVGYALPVEGHVLPAFALHELPAGLRGLCFAGLFAAAMSSLDSAICAIATAWVVDVRRAPSSSRALARTGRVASLGVAALLAGAALAMAGYQRSLAGLPPEAAPRLSLVELALSAMTIVYGGLLGVFATGLLAPGRGSDRSGVAGLGVGALAGAALFVHPVALGRTLLAWPWWIPVSALCAAAVVLAGGPRPPGRARTR